tara:strand:+ start:3428 stop:3802 length:375 start_codon:yes stop_codon:yes gene_type:complete
MKKPVLLAAFVAALSLTTIANANNYNVRNSNGAACSQSEDTGSKMEVGTTYNSFSDSTSVTAKWTFELGKGKLKKIDCNRLFNISIAREQLELDRARLEIQLLKAKIEAAKNSTEAPEPLGDDW